MWCTGGQGGKGVQCSGGGHEHVVYRGGQGNVAPGANSVDAGIYKGRETAIYVS